MIEQVLSRTVARTVTIASVNPTRSGGRPGFSGIRHPVAEGSGHECVTGSGTVGSVEDFLAGPDSACVGTAVAEKLL